MNKLGAKLLVTYFLLIFCIFLITTISFQVISERYLIKETETRLKKEVRVLGRLLGNTGLPNQPDEGNVRKRRVLAISGKLMSSKMVVWTDKVGIIYTDMAGVTLDEIQRYSKSEPGRKYVTETVTIFSKKGIAMGHVTLVAKLSELRNINGLMRRSQLISLVISALIALLLGVFFEKKITKPIRKLSNHMKHYMVSGGGNQEVEIRAKDEIGELAESFNTMVRKLKQNDSEQRKFFHNASHELKTPLMAIQGNAEGIMDGVITGAEVERSLNVIINESQRLKKIVEGITYLARLENVGESFLFKSGSLGEVIVGAVQSVRALAEQKGIEIVVENHVLRTMMLDEEKLKRAFINLLGNAIRYARETIKIRCFEAEDGGRVIIEVLDDGKGLEPGEEEKAFQRFYSGETGGSGIGLSITKAIIQAHNGTITAENRTTGGVVFRIVL